MNNSGILRVIGICFLASFLQISLAGQSQTIRGVVIDKSTKESLIGAHLYLYDSSANIRTTTNLDGSFELSDVPLGRIRVVCEYLAYKKQVTPSFVLNSAKEVFLEIEMEESSIELSEVIVYGTLHDDRTQNEMVQLSGRSFSAEETERYAGSIADPSRMAVGFAGVQASNDINNDIVIRGNSSVGVLWRLEGIDIPNPNHFSRRASSGGGISVFSVNMLRNSDFIYGAAPAEYGNTLAGVFDMKFRKGNNENTEYAFRAGLLGLDVVAEGPFKKGKGSYLLNFRYSTLGVLNELGVHVVNANTDNSFTDLAYHIYLPSEDNKSIIQLWGLGGYSSEFHHPIPEISEADNFDDFTQTDFKTSMGATGVNYTRLLDNNKYIKAKLAFTADKIIHNKDSIDLERTLGYISDEAFTSQKLTAGLEYVSKSSAKLQIKSGLSVSLQGYNLNYSALDRATRELDHYLNHQFSLGSQNLSQAYTQLLIKPRKGFSFKLGLNAMYLSLNKSYSINPQASASWNINEKNTMALAIGQHAQAVPIGSYYTQEGNIDLELMKSVQANLAYSISLSKAYKLSFELYYQKLRNIPVAVDAGLHYWMLNDLVGFSKYQLSSQGSGRNYGIEMSLEKFFSKGMFFLASASLYKSEYSLDRNVYYSSRYDGKYNTSLMIGKEFSLKNKALFQFSFRNLYYGGQHYSPANVEITERIKDYYIDDTKTLSLKNKDYWRSDLRISFRKNNQSSSWILALDVQNLLNINNTRDEIWNIPKAAFESRNQAGLIPVLSFQLDF